MASNKGSATPDKIKSLFLDLGKATKRGIRKCPQCGVMNGTRGLTCKNQDCLYVFKESSKKKDKDKDTNLEAVKIITGTVYQVFSVRLRDRGPDTRGFVQLPRIQDNHGNLVQNVDVNVLLPLLNTTANCLVEHCTRAAGGTAAPLCAHILAAVNSKGSKGEATELITKEDMFEALPMDDKIRAEIYEINSESDGPIVQRVSKNSMVVKCRPDPKRTLGFLHVTFNIPVKLRVGIDYETKFNCSCREPKSSRGSDNGSSSQRPDKRCEHFYACLAAFMSDETLSHEFSPFIKLLGVSAEENQLMDGFSEENSPMVQNATYTEELNFDPDEQEVDMPQTGVENVSEERLEVEALDPDQSFHIISQSEHEETEHPNIAVLPSDCALQAVEICSDEESVLCRLKAENGMIQTMPSDIIHHTDNIDVIGDHIVDRNSLSSTTLPSDHVTTTSDVIQTSDIITTSSIIDSTEHKSSSHEVHVHDLQDVTYSNSEQEISTANVEILMAENSAIFTSVEPNQDHQAAPQMIKPDTGQEIMSESTGEPIVTEDGTFYQPLEKKIKITVWPNQDEQEAVCQGDETAVDDEMNAKEEAGHAEQAPPTMASEILRRRAPNSTTRPTLLRFMPKKNNVEEGSNSFTFIQWLSSVTERINQTMHYQFPGSPDPLVFHAPLLFFEFLQARMAGSKKKRLPNHVSSFVRRDNMPLGTFTKFTWHITNILHVKQIFDTPKVSVDITRSFVENRDGTYDLYEKTGRERDLGNDGKNLPIRPFQLKTYLKVGHTSPHQKEPTPFIIEWIPDILPICHIGELRIKFEYGHQKNGYIVDRANELNVNSMISNVKVNSINNVK